MKSAFGTTLSVAGLMSVCYILTAANWIQVLLLFLAASLGWCVYACHADNASASLQRASQRKFFDEHVSFDQEQLAAFAAPTDAEPVRPDPPKQRQVERRPAAAPVSTPAYRFPIHKLTANSFPLSEAGT